MGIENNTERNFKDLGGMMGNAKALIRNNRECKGILIGPSLNGPSLVSVLKFRRCVLSPSMKVDVGFGLKFRGADGKPNAT